MVLRTTTQIQKIKLNLTTPNMFLKNTKAQHKFLPLLFLYLFLGAEKILPLSFLMRAALEEVDNSLYSQHQKVFPQISVSLTIKQKPAQIKTHFLVILHFFTSDFSMMKYILIFTNLRTILRPTAFQPVCYGPCARWYGLSPFSGHWGPEWTARACGSVPTSQRWAPRGLPSVPDRNGVTS